MELQNGFSPYPDFFKIYNSHRFSQHLEVPSDYRTYYPTPLPRTAVLRIPEGRFWNVKWTITQDGSISFEDGWPKFVIDYGVVDGDFVLFSYDGSRTFWVAVYRNGDPVKPKDPTNIQEISDDDEEDSTHEDNDDDDSQEYNIISLSLGSSDEDDANAMTTEVNKAPGKKDLSLRRRGAASIRNPEMYLDDQTSPFFISKASGKKPSLVITKQVIKDYGLKFGDTCTLIDAFGELEGKIRYWKDRIVVYRWNDIYRRNNAKDKDVIICEIIREEGVARAIKVHFVKK